MGRRGECEVCKEAEFKYKCPSCLVPYCSLPCFKKHKEIPCSKPTASVHITDAVPESPVNKDRPIIVDQSATLLLHDQLQSLASSTEIREALKDENLRKLVYNIDTSANPENELDKAMKVEEFRIFTEKILSAI